MVVLTVPQTVAGKHMGKDMGGCLGCPGATLTCPQTGTLVMLTPTEGCSEKGSISPSPSTISGSSPSPSTFSGSSPSRISSTSSSSAQHPLASRL